MVENDKKIELIKDAVQLTPVEEAADIGSLYRTAGINLNLANVAILLRLNALYRARGLDASISDVQKVVTGIITDPAFKQEGQ